MPVRLKDVAAHAGVSVKTVSNVVNDYKFVSDDLRKRVQVSISELGYRPNTTARSLRTGRTGAIALAVPRLRDPYFAELADQVVRAAEERGWTVLVEQTGEDPQREAAVLAGLRPTLIDGLIFSPLALDRRALDETVGDIPLVLLGEHLEDVPRTRITIDNVSAVADAVGHLAAAGRSRIAAIGVQRGPRAATAELRLAGYRAGLAAAGLRERRGWTVQVEEFQRADGARAVRRLLDGGGRTTRPDAIVCFNDLLALGALRALHEAGVAVPDDIAVIGIDDVAEAAFSVPTLSSVSLDKSQLARRAVGALAAHLDGGAPPVPGGERVVVPHRIVARESTSAPARCLCNVVPQGAH